MKKTIKAYAKRLKISKNGKITMRAKGQNHFNARERTRTSVSKRRTQSLHMSNAVRSQFLINL